MKHNVFKALRINHLLIALIIILFSTLQGQGIVSAEAQSGEINPKDSFARLAGLLSTRTLTSQPLADMEYLNKLDSHLQDLVADSLSGLSVAESAQAGGLRVF